MTIRVTILRQVYVAEAAIMKSTFEPDDVPVIIEIARSADSLEQNDVAEADNEDAKFVSEFAWLAAASVTIASIATSIGLS